MKNVQQFSGTTRRYLGGTLPMFSGHRELDRALSPDLPEFTETIVASPLRTPRTRCLAGTVLLLVGVGAVLPGSVCGQALSFVGVELREDFDSMGVGAGATL